MAEKSISVLLVTANVGSIFEDPSAMLKVWTQEFLSAVLRLDPKFIALHCQEVGGKNYEKSMKHVEYFVKLLMESEELRLFDKVRIFLDEDFSSAENFTALGNFYFIHETIKDALIWNFQEKSFEEFAGKQIYSGNIEDIASKEKSKFPQDFFPECKWSRKGFLRTRWNLSGTIFDLINIHLFHDASNFVAMETCPSVYSKNRRRALEHTLNRFHSDEFGAVPFFVFGDFNFRTDARGVVNKLTDGLSAVRIQSNKSPDHAKMQYKDEDSQIILSLSKKEFKHKNHQNVFEKEEGKWLKEFDHELEAFTGRLFEFPIQFPPTYPYEEDEKGAHNYMETRCPSWCDRVVMSSSAKLLINQLQTENGFEYGVIGPDACMGDHKPVFLKANFLTNAGMIVCCDVCHSFAHDLLSCSSPDEVFTPSPGTFPLPCDLEAKSSCFHSLKKLHSELHQSITNEDQLPEVRDRKKSCGKRSDLDGKDFLNFSADFCEEIVWMYPKNIDSMEIPKKVLEVNYSSDVSEDLTSHNVGSDVDKEVVDYKVFNGADISLLSTRTESSNRISEDSGIDGSSEQDIAPLSERRIKMPLERFFKRVQSASFVEVSSKVTPDTSQAMSPRIGVKMCRCLSDSSWRKDQLPADRPLLGRNSRMRLVSVSSSQSLLRHISHHSSSDEEWFEEVTAESDDGKEEETLTESTKDVHWSAPKNDSTVDSLKLTSQYSSSLPNILDELPHSSKTKFRFKSDSISESNLICMLKDESSVLFKCLDNENKLALPRKIDEIAKDNFHCNEENDLLRNTSSNCISMHPISERTRKRNNSENCCYKFPNCCMLQ